MRLPTFGGLLPWEFEKDGREVNVQVEGQLIFNTGALGLRATLDGLGLGYCQADIRRAVSRRRPPDQRARNSPPVVPRLPPLLPEPPPALGHVRRHGRSAALSRRKGDLRPPGQPGSCRRARRSRSRCNATTRDTIRLDHPTTRGLLFRQEPADIS